MMMSNLLELEIPSRKHDRFNYTCYENNAKALNGIRTLKPSKKGTTDLHHRHRQDLDTERLVKYYYVYGGRLPQSV